MLSVPTEAGALLGLIAICMAFLLVFYLYITKKFCFNTICGFPCCDEPLKVGKNESEEKKTLRATLSFEEEAYISSDSEDELLKRLQRSTDTFNNLKKTTNHICNESFERRNIKSLKNRAQSFNIHKFDIRRKTGPRILLRSESASENRTSITSINSNFVPIGPADLISLAEKGRIGKNGSSGGSCSSEAGSADIDEDSQLGFSKDKKRKILGSKISKINQSVAIDEESKSQYNIAFEKYESDAHSSHSQESSSQNNQSDSQISKCGLIEIGYAYDAPTKKLKVTVFNGQEIPSKERGGANQVHVRLVLLPHKRQKQKTKVKSNTNSITFNETLTFNRINPEEIMNLGVRFRVYGTSFARREHLISEVSIAFARIKPQQQETRLTLTLEPRSNLSQSDSRSEVSSLERSDSTCSTPSMHHLTLPELLLGLAYNGTTGRLNVSIIKGSQFRNVSMPRAPDTYAKLSLMSSSGQEIARSKTSVRRGQPNPLFKETFVFQVALFQLPDVTLMISIFNKRSIKRKEMIGWYSLGFNSSGDEELSHWNDMRDAKGEQVCRWHVLLES